MESSVHNNMWLDHDHLVTTYRISIYETNVDGVVLYHNIHLLIIIIFVVFDDLLKLNWKSCFLMNPR